MTQQEQVPCHYDQDRQGVRQCPRCQRWFCQQCVDELFLGMALINGQTATLPRPICAQCHAELFEPSMRQRIKGE